MSCLLACNIVWGKVMSPAVQACYMEGQAGERAELRECQDTGITLSRSLLLCIADDLSPVKRLALRPAPAGLAGEGAGWYPALSSDRMLPPDACHW